MIQIQRCEVHTWSTYIEVNYFEEFVLDWSFIKTEYYISKAKVISFLNIQSTCFAGQFSPLPFILRWWSDHQVKSLLSKFLHQCYFTDWLKTETYIFNNQLLNLFNYPQVNTAAKCLCMIFTFKYQSTIKSWYYFTLTQLCFWQYTMTIN